MRNSKAKALRKVLKNMGINPTEAVYRNVAGSEKLKPIMSVDGTKVVGTFTTVTTELEPNCGRARYQRFKAF